MHGDLAAQVAALTRRLDRLERRTRQHVSFARTTATANDNGPVQTTQAQIDALSVRNDVPMLFYYGFSSAMPMGGDKLVVHGNGERSSAVAIASGHQQYRFTGLNDGEVVLYDQWGNVIHFTQNAIQITGTVQVTGDLQVTGEVIRGYQTSDQVGLGTHEHTISGPAPIAGT